MEQKLREFIERGVASEFCKRDLEKLGYRDLKSVQMKGMWRAIELAEKEGVLVRKLPIGEAWKAVKKFIDNPQALEPYCKIPSEEA